MAGAGLPCVGLDNYFFCYLCTVMFAKEVYVRRRKALLDKMKGERGIALFIGNVDALLSTIA